MLWIYIFFFVFQTSKCWGPIIIFTVIFIVIPQPLSLSLSRCGHYVMGLSLYIGARISGSTNRWLHNETRTQSLFAFPLRFTWTTCFIRICNLLKFNRAKCRSLETIQDEYEVCYMDDPTALKERVYYSNLTGTRWWKKQYALMPMSLLVCHYSCSSSVFSSNTFE